ncbi:uncharacterized protein LOC112344451 [Selaginella moellendorffii]|uniref:uncharacterized protein LOC112344451 n=1 Tax=Selaginella moellendorffii TaxID=88036 RepID=UPI000D1CC46D|nr:uncharacterized protein LOC112344451 [Selaginella moellendorffii]XP_024525017.1 uncharacterized protein LOC112344451 [Selaginella moellendorffii]|eukprot:XP_024525016.1 uncharacterized protein LOC112344451 [Selaginella moellendorffii]
MVVLELLVVLDLLELLVVVLVDKVLIGGGDVVVVEMVSGGRGVVVEVVRISELEMSRHHRLRLLLLLGMENHTVVVEWEALENAATVGRWRRHDPVWLVVDRRRRGWRRRWRLEIIAAMQAPIEALAEELGGRERRLQVVVRPLGIARLERGLGGERRDGAGEEPARGGGGGVQRVAVDELGRHVGAAGRAAGALEGRPAVDIQVAQVVLLALVQPRHVAPQRHAAGGTVRYRSRSRRRRCYRIARRIRGLGSDLLLLLLLVLLVLVVVFGSAGLPRGDGDGHLVLGILRGARVLLDDLAERENVRLDESGGGELLLDGLRLGSHRRGGLLRGLTGTATGSAATVGGARLGLRHYAAAAADTPRGTAAAAAAAARAAAEAAGRRAVEIQRGGGGRWWRRWWGRRRIHERGIGGEALVVGGGGDGGSGGDGVGDATHFDLLRIPLPPISLPSLLTGAASL